MIEPELSRGGASSWLRDHAGKVVASLLLAVAFAWVLTRGGLPLAPRAEDLARVDARTYALYFLTLLAMQAFRATRWRHLLAPVGHVPFGRMLTVSYLGFAAILLLPLRAGEFVRPYLVRDRVGLAAATGTIGAERVIDGLFLTTMLGACLPISGTLSPLPARIADLGIPVAVVPFYAYLALVGFLAAFALMALFYWRPAIGHVMVARTLGLVSAPLASRAEDFVKRLAEGLRFLPSVRHFGPFLVETTLYWMLNALGMWILARGCGLDGMTFVRTCVVMGVVGVGILVPAGPGLFGAFQASAFAALAMFFSKADVVGPGGTFVFLLYVIQFAWHVLSGGVCLFLESRANRARAEGRIAGGPA